MGIACQKWGRVARTWECTRHALKRTLHQNEGARWPDTTPDRTSEAKSNQSTLRPQTSHIHNSSFHGGSGQIQDRPTRVFVRQRWRRTVCRNGGSKNPGAMLCFSPDDRPQCALESGRVLPNTAPNNCRARGLRPTRLECECVTNFVHLGQPLVI